MNRTVGPPNVRNSPGSLFQSQQHQSARNPPFNVSRLQNGKIASGAGWNYSMGGTGAPGLASPPQSRPSGSMNSFAQTIGGAHSQPPLDLSEFPSLSGAPPAQTNPSAQAAWGTQGLRDPPNTNSQQRAPNHPQPQNSESQTPPFSSLSSAVENYRSSLSGQQRQQGGVEDFPPLSGLGGNGDAIQSRSNGSAFGPVTAQLRHEATALEAQRESLGLTGASDRILTPVEGHLRRTPSTRTPFEGGQTEQDASQTGHLSQNSSKMSSIGASHLPFRNAPGTIGDQQRPSQVAAALGSIKTNTANDVQNEGSTPAQMSEAERYGLPGFVELLRQPTNDQQSYMYGMDLSSLGLELSRPENQPLYLDWAGPFADANAQPVVPEFTLPAAYNVQGVPPIRSKIGSFSDDTLFMLFYQYPRDELQEMAASELYARDWRWHKKLQQWMMKAKEMGEPMISQSRTEERGWYYFWNPKEWQRDRKEFILSYEHLHHALPAAQTIATTI